MSSVSLELSARLASPYNKGEERRLYCDDQGDDGGGKLDGERLDHYYSVKSRTAISSIRGHMHLMPSLTIFLILINLQQAFMPPQASFFFLVTILSIMYV